MPSHAIVALFQTVADLTSLQLLGAYDTDVQVQGQSLDCLLNLIPRQMHLVHIGVNLDFMAESVLSSYDRNTSIQYLFFAGRKKRKDPVGPISLILERNRRLFLTNGFLLVLVSRIRRRFHWVFGPWEWSDSPEIHRVQRPLTRFLREKLVHWWGPSGPTTVPAPPAAGSSVVSISTGKRSLFRMTQPDDDGTTRAKRVRLDFAFSDATK
jgi:hypothetical protein